MRYSIRSAFISLFMIIISATANLTNAHADGSAIKAVDVYVVSGTSFVPGSVASLRILTRGVTGIQSSQPIPFANVSITISNGQQNKLLFTGASDLLGLTLAQFRVPDWPSGIYRIDVQAQCPFGTQVVSHPATLEHSSQIHLIVDRLVVRPGQCIKYRALALNATDLKPLSHQPIRFEIRNPKGDQISRKWVQANRFGIASDNYHLADSVDPGAYEIFAYLETSQPVVFSNASVLVGTASLPKSHDDLFRPATKNTLNILAISEESRLVAELNNRILVGTYDFNHRPVKTTVTIKHGNKSLNQVMTHSNGIAVFSIRPELAWLEKQKDLPIENSTDDIFTSKNHTRSHNAPRCLYLQIEAQNSKGLKGQINRCFNMQPSVDRISIETDKSVYENGSLVRGGISTTMDKRICHFDLIKNQQTLLTRSILLQQKRGSFDFILRPHMIGLLELHAYFITDNGTLIKDVRLIYVRPMHNLKIEISRDRSVYRPGQKGCIKLSVRSYQNKPIQAALSITSYEVTSDKLGRVPIELQYVIKNTTAINEPTFQLPDQKEHAGVDFVLQQIHNQNAARIVLQQIPSKARLSIWSNPIWTRTNKAIQDRQNILQALYIFARTQPLGTKTPGGKWNYRNDLLEEILNHKLLSPSNLTDPLGQPYSMKKLASLWPDMKANSFLVIEEIKRLWNLRYVAYSRFRERITHANIRNTHDLAIVVRESFQFAMNTKHVSQHDVTGKPYKWEDLKNLPGFRLQDWTDQEHMYRAQRIYRALSQYGKDNQRWFRLGMLDKKHNMYNFPNDAIQRVIARGYLDKQNSQDVWSRPFRLKKLHQPRQHGVLDQRLRYYLVYSVGQDSLDNTKDDCSYSSFTDGGFTDLIKSIGSSLKNVDLLTDWITTIKARHSTSKKPDSTDTQALDAAYNNFNIPAYDSLVFVPALITDEKGHAHLEFRLPLKKTTWRLKIWVNSMMGGMGYATHEIKAF